MIVYPTAADLRRLFPHGRADILEPLCAALPAVCEKLQVNTVLRVGHFLAQAGHEADGFATYEEYASGAAYEGRVDLGNTRPGDGRRFKGRGPIQLTGRDNYQRSTQFVRDLLGRPTLDLIATPTIVSTDRAVGLASSLWFWTTNNLNRYADLNDAKAVSRGVNRGNPKSDKPAMHEDERITITTQVLAMLRSIQGRAPLVTGIAPKPANDPVPLPVDPATAPQSAPPTAVPVQQAATSLAQPPAAVAAPATSFWGRIKAIFSKGQ